MITYTKVGIIGAMDEEIRLLLGSLEDSRQMEKAGIVFYSGKLWGRDAVVCKCGVGKVNAALCTQALIDEFSVEAVIFTGVAGAVDPELEIGDLVVSKDCMYHDMDATALGFALGEIPFAPSSVFAADRALVEAAVSAGRKAYPELRTIEGRVLSGDQFVADYAKVAAMREKLGGSCTEMEGAAVAHACALSGIPYVVIRSMSDKADGSAHVNFAEFTVKASEHSFGIVREMLSQA